MSDITVTSIAFSLLLIAARPLPSHGPELLIASKVIRLESIYKGDASMFRPLAISLFALSASAGVAFAQTSTTPTTPSAPAGTPAQTGQTQERMRAVDTTSTVVTFITAGPADVLTSNLVGIDVVNNEGEEIGEIEDLIIEDGKTVRAIIVSVGGFLGIGERYVAVDPASVTLTPDGDDWEARIDTNADELKAAPEFEYDGEWDR